MKHIAQFSRLAALAVMTAFAATPGTSRAEAPKNPEMTVERLSAQIRSSKDLASYLLHTQISRSPLRFMSAPARKEFLASLRFDDAGVIGFSHAGFAGLRATEAYQILALFGAQRATAGVEGLASRDEVDGLILKTAVPGFIRNGYYPHYLAGGKFECFPQDGSCLDPTAP